MTRQQRAAESAGKPARRSPGVIASPSRAGETQHGTIYRAYDIEAQREVRLLRLNPSCSANRRRCTQIELEVEVEASLEHPNLLRFTVRDDGRQELSGHGMDRGFYTLLELLARRRGLSAAEVLAVLRQAAAGADARWSAGARRWISHCIRCASISRRTSIRKRLLRSQ